ncbi:MAG TPA: hypothetical protein VKQ36_05950, partial [Ktedonobacterales bacterium]|nr:hypothetical protein [Ktedonobacterales bacterium]
EQYMSEQQEHDKDESPATYDEWQADASNPENSDDAAGVENGEDGEDNDDGEARPLVRVRYGLGKELQLFDDTLVVVSREEAAELRVNLANIHRLILAPGDPTPSKLVLMFDLDDGSTIIAAEGMSNVSDFRKLLERLQDIRPEIELDPPDMDAQLAQALEIRRRSNIGCYGVMLGACLLLWLIYLAVVFIGAHGGHITP